MKQELKDKIAKLTQLQKEARELEIEITCEVESQYSKYIGKRVKIIGQKGWSTGILKSVKANLSYSKPGQPEVHCFVSCENGRDAKSYIPFKSLKFLNEKEIKEFNMNNSITNK
jgi:hypothetical protein